MALPTENLAISYRDSINDSVIENRLDEALSTLQDFVGNLAPHLKDTVLLLRRRHSQYRSDSRDGVAEKNEADIIARRILEIVAEAERQPAVRPKYALGHSAVHAVAAETEAPVSRAPLRLVSAPDEPDTSSGADSTGPDSGATVDEQLRNHWCHYRADRPPESTEAVTCDKITKGFPGSHFQLEELSFSIRTGQITGVVGRNASGKTTLLRILLGEIQPDSGTMSYPALTQDAESWPHIKRQIGYIPQFAERWPGRVKTNLHFIAATSGSFGLRNRDLVDWYVQRYGLSQYQHATWATLSGGFRMRYELARVLVSKPLLLVLDEPLASLDVLARHEFLKNLRAIAYSLEEPIPIVVTSQHLYEIEAIADQMIVLDDGKCLFCGSLSDIERRSATRLYEVQINMPKPTAQDQLRRIGMTILEVTSDGYIIETKPEIKSHEGLKSLVSAFDRQLIGVRDITGSSRRFFVDSSAKPIEHGE